MTVSFSQLVVLTQNFAVPDGFERHSRVAVGNQNRVLNFPLDGLVDIIVA